MPNDSVFQCLSYSRYRTTYSESGDQRNITNIHHNTSLTNKHHLSAYAQKKEEFIQFYNKQNEKDNSSVDEKYKKILEVK